MQQFRLKRIKLDCSSIMQIWILLIPFIFWYLHFFMPCFFRLTRWNNRKLILLIFYFMRLYQNKLRSNLWNYWSDLMKIEWIFIMSNIWQIWMHTHQINLHHSLWCQFLLAFLRSFIEIFFELAIILFVFDELQSIGGLKD
jgi:hypothetical protein